MTNDIEGGKKMVDPKYLENLSDEQKEKLKKCRDVNEVMALVDEEGYEMDEEQMAAVSGGGWSCEMPEYCCEEGRDINGRVKK